MNQTRASFGAATPATLWQPRRYLQFREFLAAKPPASAFAGRHLQGADAETKADALVAAVAHTLDTHSVEAGMRSACRYGIEAGARLYMEERSTPMPALLAKLARLRERLAANPNDRGLQACRAFLELRILQRRGVIRPGQCKPMGVPGTGFGGAFGAKDTYGVYRQFDTGDGYVYRQYTDGTIQIVRSPRGGAGTFLRGNPADPNYAKWLAITNQIKAIKQGRGAKAGEAATTALTSIAALLQSLQTPRAPVYEEPVEPLPYEEPPSTDPLLVAGGIGVGLLALLLLLRG